MRVLLCKNQTELYYQAPDRWVAEADAAEDFVTSHRAALFAQEKGLCNVEVLLDFGDLEYNVRLPVGMRQRLRPTEEVTRSSRSAPHPGEPGVVRPVVDSRLLIVDRQTAG